MLFTVTLFQQKEEEKASNVADLGCRKKFARVNE
jgi:hypothetical protein